MGKAIVKGGAEVVVKAPADLSKDAAEAWRFINGSKAENTKKAYRSDWAHFCRWCDERGQTPIPATPETVAAYLAHCAGEHKASTLERRVSSISVAHKAAGHDSPTAHQLVRSTMAGIRRELGTAPTQKAPALVSDVRVMVESLPDSLVAVRDRALLLVGFAGAFRRSELVALDTTDVEDRSEGLVVTLRRSKSDQEGRGRKVGIPYGSHPQTCPVRALRAYLETVGITEGPLFRRIDRHGHVGGRLSAPAVALVVKRAAQRAGLDPTVYAGHSLRSGLATSAAAAGASERAIMQQTGHKSLPMVRRYIREGSVFRENAAAVVGL